MKKLIIVLFYIMMLSCCSGSPELKIQSGDVMYSINLTVEEGKRLIAKGIANLPQVRQKMHSGMIVITKGSTNSYIAEELCNMKVPEETFVIGHFAPKDAEESNAEVRDEIILVDGKVVDMGYLEALEQMKAGDIIFKGGNLLDYDNRQAAVCIGAANGGTTFKLLPYISKGVELIIPIGLEKQVFGKLSDYEKILTSENERLNYIPKIRVFHEGKVFTEIEAIKAFADVEVFPMGSGGIKGREGGISLVVAGTPEEINKICKLF